MDDGDHVGELVRVYWEREEEWFHGVIDDYDPIKGYHILYFEPEDVDEWVRKLYV